LVISMMRGPSHDNRCDPHHTAFHSTAVLTPVHNTWERSHARNALCTFGADILLSRVHKSDTCGGDGANADVDRPPAPERTDAVGRVGMWRGGGRSNISVSASFVWRCLSGSTVAPFPHPAHRTGHADLPHPALGQALTPSPTTRRAQARSGVRAQSARKGARVDSSRPCVV